MPMFHFRFERGSLRDNRARLDLDDFDMARRVAKYVTRQLASRELVYGRIDLADNLVITDEESATAECLPIGPMLGQLIPRGAFENPYPV